MEMMRAPTRVQKVVGAELSLLEEVRVVMGTHSVELEEANLQVIEEGVEDGVKQDQVGKTLLEEHHSCIFKLLQKRGA